MTSNFIHKNIDTLNFLLLTFMAAALFISRATLSISMMLYVLLALAYYSSSKPHKKLKLSQSRYALLFGVMFLMGTLTYFYSENRELWLNYIRVWLPMIILPFSFFILPTLSPKRFYILLSIYVLVVTIGTFWSLSSFLQDPQTIIDSYQHAKVLPTPLEGDHIRFSLTVVMAACISVVLAMVSYKKRMLLKGEQSVWVLTACYLFIYLHILAVKSGLLAGWLTFGWMALFFLIKKNYKLSFLLIGFVVVIPIFSYFCIPTFQQKLGYVKYEFAENKATGRVKHLSDVNRLVSYELAWRSIMQHPITGVGLGDIDQEMQDKYHQYYPEVVSDSILLPHNQWFCNGLAMGFPGMIILTMIYLFPLSLKIFRHSFMGISLMIVGLVSLMVEPVLMVQIGIATYLYLTLLFFAYYTSDSNRDTKLVFGCENLLLA